MQNSFSERLIRWYESNGRELPWRFTKDPYKIWISEIILQQTRVAQGMDYYHNFIRRFPSVKELANAEEQEVLVMWQGLGYYSRARNLHHAARNVMEHFGGEFPKQHKEIRGLKGIGDYTAAAISSFAFGLPHPAVDGNAYRVFSRYFGIDLPMDKPEGQKVLKALIADVFDRKRPDLFNQAVMDLGACVCTPRQAKCPECPLQEDCRARFEQRVEELPVKQGKTLQKDRYFSYIVFLHEGKTYIRERKQKDIWKGLYEFPLIESASRTQWESLADRLPKELNTDSLLCRSSKNYLHILSHQRIHTHFFVIEKAWNDSSIMPMDQASEFQLVSTEEWDAYPFSRLIERFLEDEKIF